MPKLQPKLAELAVKKNKFKNPFVYKINNSLISKTLMRFFRVEKWLKSHPSNHAGLFSLLKDGCIGGGILFSGFGCMHYIEL